MVFKSYEELASTQTTPSYPADEAAIDTTMLNPLTTTSKSGFLPTGVYEWLSSGFNIFVSVATSGGFVCSCLCGVKFVRNGCVFKVIYIYALENSGIYISLI